MGEIIAALLAALAMLGPAQGDYEVAVRGDQVVVSLPPPEPATGPYYGSAVSGRCTQYEPMLEYFSPGWDIDQFSKIMWRESRCTPDAANSCCSGLLQIHRLHIPNLGACDVYSRDDLYQPDKNICSAAVVYRLAGGTSPWSQTR